MSVEQKECENRLQTLRKTANTVYSEAFDLESQSLGAHIKEITFPNRLKFYRNTGGNDERLRLDEPNGPVVNVTKNEHNDLIIDWSKDTRNPALAKSQKIIIMNNDNTKDNIQTFWEFSKQPIS
jgi:hypothetical protein